MRFWEENYGVGEDRAARRDRLVVEAGGTLRKSHEQEVGLNMKSQGPPPPSPKDLLPLKRIHLLQLPIVYKFPPN